MTNREAGDERGIGPHDEPSDGESAEQREHLPLSDVVPGRDPLVPAPGLPFGSSYRTPRARWWRGLLSIVAVFGGVLVLSSLLTIVATVVDLALGMQDVDAVLSGRVSMTPLLLVAANLSLAAAGGLAIVAHRFISGVRIGFFSSVQPGFRWRWARLSAVIIAPLYLAYALLSFLDPAFQVVTFTTTTLAFVLIILLTTPLQAAAEEYIFRGVIQRAAGAWLKSPVWSFVVGTVVSATLFSIAHFAADPWLIGYYFLFGAGLSLLTQLTGGLESAIVVHVANNVFLLLVSASAGQMDAGFDRSLGVGGPELLLPVLLLAIVIAAVAWAARRRALRRVTV